MSEHTQVAVIGGGVVGVSVLYHLTKAGFKDVMLLERSELTSGSTWHAAGGFHTLNGDPNVAKLQQYTIELYKEIEEISGQSCGFHLTGGVMLAGTKERMDWLKMAHARGRYLGMDTELISAREAADIMPLLNPDEFVGGIYDTMEGHLDPSGVTHAYAKSARKNGATIKRHTRVTALTQRTDGSWNVITTNGDIHAEHVVNAGGLWAREVGRMVGLELPVLAMEHMYLLTEDMQEVIDFNASTGKEIPHVIDFEGELYLRQERQGMLMGTYEKAGKPWSVHSTPWDFDTELLEPDIDRIAPSLEVGFRHFPAFEKTGIKQIINGPFTFAPDGNPLIGPVRGLRNYWVAAGVMAGFSQGGGVGLALANWITEGDPGFDVWAMDVSRFGDWATMAYAHAKVRENYSRRFQIRYPNEELEAARPVKTTPIYDRLKSHGAVFGQVYGLESALWFATDGQEPRDIFSFRRSNDFKVVAEECRAVREEVALIEISGFANYEVDGPGAAEWLDYMLANKLPGTGRMALSPMLNPAGGLIGDFTVSKMAPERYFIAGSGAAEAYHMRWFESHMPNSGVRMRAASLDFCGLQLAGPRSRELLQRVTHRDLSKESFRFMAIDEFQIGLVPARVGRVSFTGSLGYEIWVRPEYLCTLFDLLIDAASDMPLKFFGSRALNSLRLEKNWGTWAREYRPIYTPFEAGLERFVALDKGQFIGRDAALIARDAGARHLLTVFTVDADNADVISDEPVWRDNEVVGWVTSGGYAHYTGKSVAMGYVRADAFDANGDYQIEIIGDKRSARVQTTPLYDPDGEVMRG
ncbi:MAG: glycine cleavage system protein T [marine bacterium B5-7]|nr:MAG: glycine cleavage system protein T [marine bacterium B5-7]